MGISRILLVLMVFSLGFLTSGNNVLVAQDVKMVASGFDLKKSKVEAEKLEQCANFLIRFANSQYQRDKKFFESKKYHSFVKMALMLSENNKNAVIASGRIRKEKEPKAPSEDLSVDDFVKGIKTFKKQVDALKNADAEKIGGYLVSLAFMVKEDDDDLEYELELFSKKYGEVKWEISQPAEKKKEEVKSEREVDSKDKFENGSRQVSIKGLVVMQVGGQSVGKTSKILATFFPSRQKSNMISVEFVRGYGKGGSMHVSLNEAVRYWKTLKIQSLHAGTIEMSFEDKYSMKDGGSAGTAYVILLRSLDEGFDIDPKFAVTGDVSVEGKILKIGGVYEKIRGALVDGCLYAGIPASNESELIDKLIINGIDTLGDIEIYKFDKIDDILELAKKKKAKKYEEISKIFAKVKVEIDKENWAEKAKTNVLPLVDKMLALDKNNLSAKLLKDHIEGTLPKTLSLTASINEIDNRFMQYLSTISLGGELSLSNISQETKTTNITRFSSSLTKLRDMIHQDSSKVMSKARSISTGVRAYVSAKNSAESYARKLKEKETALEKRTADHNRRRNKASLRAYNAAVRSYNSTLAKLKEYSGKRDKNWDKIFTAYKEYIAEIRVLAQDAKQLENLIRGK